jgi:hypothetical protein
MGEEKDEEKLETILQRAYYTRPFPREVEVSLQLLACTNGVFGGAEMFGDVDCKGIYEYPAENLPSFCFQRNCALLVGVCRM